ncbi:MAG: hypothetical protein ACXADX_16725, partial [Candidatus Hodarchaeales archaeon]
MRLETQSPPAKAQERPSISTDAVPSPDGDSKYTAITRSRSFQDLVDFSEQLDEAAPAKAVPETIPNLIKYVQE